MGLEKTFSTIGARNCSTEKREENDFYSTPSYAVELLLTECGETFNQEIWEPACGSGNISEVLKANGYEVRSSDLINRGYGEAGIDFLKEKKQWSGDIVTNPPYKLATEFVQHALELIPEGNKVCMLLKLQFLETQKRRKLFERFPPKRIHVASNRITCPKNGIVKEKYVGALCYAWFVWEKGFKGAPTLHWFN